MIFLTLSLANAFPSNWRPGVHRNTLENRKFFFHLISIYVLKNYIDCFIKIVEKLKNLKSGELAWIYSGQYQGDIVLSPEQVKLLQSRNGIININQRWPKIIPYVLDPTYSKF